MEPFVGTQYSVEQIWTYYRSHTDVYPDEEAQLRPLAARIRAFNVPVLSGATFTITRLSDTTLALYALLTEKLPGIPWDPAHQVHLGRIKKYGIIHEVVEAPLDGATQSAMVLEVYGHLDPVNGQTAGRDWYRELYPSEPSNGEDAVIGEMIFRLSLATYANTRTPGIGVPFYM